LRDARNTLSRWPLTLGACGWIGVLAPVRGHSDPNLTIDWRRQESCFDISRNQFAAVFGGDGEHRSECDVLGDGSERVIEVDPFLHELTFYHPRALYWLPAESSTGGPVLDAKNPICRSNLDRFNALVPLLSPKVPFLV